MLCPKCGSELHYNTDERSKIDWICSNHIFGCDYTLIDEDEDCCAYCGVEVDCNGNCTCVESQEGDD